MKQQLLFIIGLLLFTSMQTFAQSSTSERISMTTYNSKAQRETQFMADSLNLSPSQISQVDSVNKSYLKNIALLEGQSISAAARKQRIIDYKTERDSGLEIILTEQQHHRYKDLLKSQENRMKVRSQTLQNQ